jgi:hypothetical protein
MATTPTIDNARETVAFVVRGRVKLEDGTWGYGYLADGNLFSLSLSGARLFSARTNAQIEGGVWRQKCVAPGFDKTSVETAAVQLSAGSYQPF